MNSEFFLAIKYLLNKKHETIIVIFAITIGVIGPLFTAALNNGMQDAFVGNTVNVITGHLQILPEIGEKFIPKSDSLVSKLKDIKGIKGVAQRIQGGVEIESKTKRLNLGVVGINPEEEKKASTLSKSVVEGEFLEKDDEDEILIGTSLAEELKLEVGDEVWLTFIKGHPQKFRVKGIISTGTWNYDRYTVFLTYKTAKQMLDVSDASYIIIRLYDSNKVDEFRTIIEKETLNTNIKTWKELAAGTAGMVKTFGIISFLTSMISIIVAATSISLIIYTTVKNKTRDIGVLKAIGARNSMIFYIFLIESLLIGVIGITLGTIIGFCIINWIQAKPIIMHPEAGMQLIIRPWISIQTVIITDFMILATCIIGGIYPAISASRISIIKAIWSG